MSHEGIVRSFIALGKLVWNVPKITSPEANTEYRPKNIAACNLRPNEHIKCGFKRECTHVLHNYVSKTLYYNSVQNSASHIALCFHCKRLHRI